MSIAQTILLVYTLVVCCHVVLLQLNFALQHITNVASHSRLYICKCLDEVYWQVLQCF